MKPAFRCYLCGQPAGEHFHVWSLNADADRVFVTCSRCISRLDEKDKPTVILVRRVA